MQLTKRTRDKSSSSSNSQDALTGFDSGDIIYDASSTNSGTGLHSHQPTSIISPRKSIRDYSPNCSAPKLYEDSYLLYKGRKSYPMILLAKTLTWITKLSIYYQHRQYLTRRIWIYFILILIAGLIRDYALVTPSLLPDFVIEFIETHLKTSKKHFLNIYFVKWGWLWTFIALIPFYLITRFYSTKRIFEVDHKHSDKIGRKKSVHFREPLEDNSNKIDNQNKRETVASVENIEEELENINLEEDNLPFILFGKQFLNELFPAAIRLSITTIIWYFSVKFFVYYANIDGHCINSNSTVIESASNKLECFKQEGKWKMGFDISGHIFLMAFSNLIRIDELTFFSKRFDEFAQFRYLRLSPTRSMNYATPYRFEFNLFHFLSFALILISTMVTIIWDFMIIQTSFFYHTWQQKIAGLVWAIISWAISYGAMFALPMLHLQVVS